jgi:hypothetical protein
LVGFEQNEDTAGALEGNVQVVTSQKGIDGDNVHVIGGTWELAKSLWHWGGPQEWSGARALARGDRLTANSLWSWEGKAAKEN